MALKLYDIPRLLPRGFDVRVPETQPDPNEKCLFCRRPYQPQDEEKSEEYCEPRQVYPCKHFIGKDCLDELLREGILDCQYCRTLIGTSASVPKWIQWIADCPIYTLQVDYVASMFEDPVSMVESNVPRELQKPHLIKTFHNRTFTVLDGWHLWKTCMRCHLGACLAASVVFVSAQIFFWALSNSIMCVPPEHRLEVNRMRSNFWKQVFGYVGEMGLEGHLKANQEYQRELSSLPMVPSAVQWLYEVKFFATVAMICSSFSFGLYLVFKKLIFLRYGQGMCCLLIANEVYYALSSALMVGFALWKTRWAREQ